MTTLIDESVLFPGLVNFYTARWLRDLGRLTIASGFARASYKAYVLAQAFALTHVVSGEFPEAFDILEEINDSLHLPSEMFAQSSSQSLPDPDEQVQPQYPLESMDTKSESSEETREIDYLDVIGFGLEAANERVSWFTYPPCLCSLLFVCASPVGFGCDCSEADNQTAGSECL